MLNNLVKMLNGLEEKSFESEEDRITEKDINELGFVLINNEFLLAINDIAIAGMFILNFDSIEGYTPMIVIDNNFKEMTNNSKLFIVAHEIGHFKYHIHRITNPEYIRNINDEFEADEYAAESIGFENAINGLNELKQTLLDLCFDLEEEGVKEIELRIENLMNKSMVTC